MGYPTFITLAVLVVVTLLAIGRVVRECVRGTRPLVVTLMNVLAGAAFLVVVWTQAELERYALLGQCDRIWRYLHMQSWGLTACMLLIIIGAVAGPFFDPKAHREADELVERYKNSEE